MSLRYMLIIGFMVFMVIAIGADMALGWLHKDGQIFVCFDCHVQFSPDEIITPGPSLIKEQYEAINLLCRSCHYSGGSGTDAKTHVEPVSGAIDCTACHNPHRHEGDNIALIRERIKTLGGELRNVTFTAANSIYADGDSVRDGICEVCHTQTRYHRNDEYLFSVAWTQADEDELDNEGGVPTTIRDGFAAAGITLSLSATVSTLPGDTWEITDTDAGLIYTIEKIGSMLKVYYYLPSHYESESQQTCTDQCHDHESGFAAGVGGGAHPVHTEDKVLLGCDGCHSIPPSLKTGTDLDSTDVCDSCHSSDGVSLAKFYWHKDPDTWLSTEGELNFCGSCHDNTPGVALEDVITDAVSDAVAPDIVGDNTTRGFYITGHGRSGADKTCTDCHDTAAIHVDGYPRTYSFDSAYYAPSQSGLAYAAGYRLLNVSGEVPLMIPANYNITFNYNAQTMRDIAFRLCFECHDSTQILDDTPGNGIDSKFKASLPNPPRNYSYARGSGADVNEHVAHIMNYVGPFADSDWDVATNGQGGSNGNDSLTACSSCHNVHGVDGTHGSTNEAMIRDGSLTGRTGYGFSYVVEDSGGYPWVTSTGASQSNSVGSIFRNNTADMCGGSMCHGEPTPPPASSYDATGSSWGTYLEYYRPPPAP